MKLHKIFYKFIKIFFKMFKLTFNIVLKPKRAFNNLKRNIKSYVKKLKPLGRLFKQYVKKYIFYMILSMILMVVVALTTSGIAYIIGPSINEIFIKKESNLLYGMCGILILLYLLKTSSTYIQELSQKILCAKVTNDIRCDIFAKMIKMPMVDVENTPNGRSTALFLSDVNVINGSIQQLFVASIRDLLTVICLIFVVFYNDWLLAIIAFCAYPLIFVPLIKTSKKLREKFASGQIYNEEISNKLMELTNGMKTIKSYCTEGVETRKMRKLLISLTRTLIDFSKMEALASPAMELAAGLSIVLIMFIGGTRIINGSCDVGSFFSFFTALIMMHRPARSLSGLNVKMQIVTGTLERVFDYMDNLRSESLNEGLKPELYNKTIKFENVNFDYKITNLENNKEENITLKDINLTIKPKTKIALVGISGSGKSTIANLLLRLYEYNSGKISIDNIDIKDMAISHLRQNIAYIGQDNFLFNDSIKNNILYGAKNDDISEEKISYATNLSQMGFVDALPNHLDENVGYNGSKFSLGQRQRIAIARAIIKDAPIVIFDEATSALDAETEHLIRTAIFDNMQDKTTIIVAHRLSTIVSCDMIYVMDNGYIVESGTHSQLLQKDGLYKHLWSSLNDDKNAK